MGTPFRRWQYAMIVICVTAGMSCNQEPVPLATATPRKPIEDLYGINSHTDIKFKDDTSSNSPLDDQLADLEFTNLEGQSVSLRDYLGKKHLVLVITRGSTKYICVYCSTQTSRLVTQYDAFVKRGAEVLVVFPLKAREDNELAHDFLKFVKEKLPSSASDKIPFPLVLDVELKSVDRLGLRHNLAKPATYIMDKTGDVRFAYVGENEADRPSVKALLSQLDEMNAETPLAQPAIP